MGVGPGDPELMTVKGAALLGQCRHVFVPKSPAAAESVALSIAEPYLCDKTEIHELIFPMTPDPMALSRQWQANARAVADILITGEDACFITLGDTFLYSTFIYLVRELQICLPDVEIVSVPGITAFSAAASVCRFPVGVGKEPVTIVPTADDLESVRRALAEGETIVLMKVGRRLGDILDLLEEAGVIEESVFVSRVGMTDQRIETDLRRLRGEAPEAGYLSVILVHAKGVAS
ncbi:MAG: precorrin-2 C(20)-methyltransferase [Syntrophales bacterium]|nr:precorrin-2 C(20)-methyltransferase [Syntrophales bacterium]